jgi:hypothetical protein
MTEAFFYGLFAGIALSVIVVNIALRIATRRAERQIEELAAAINALSPPKIEARVEEQDGVFYVYRADDNSFLAQGTNLPELRQRIESRMKDVMVYVTEGDAEVLARLKSTGTETTHA